MTGPGIDIKYYSAATPWTMDGMSIKVMEENKHLEQIVSGSNQTITNIDNRLKKGRG